MIKRIVLQWKHPVDAIQKQGPKVLEWIDRKGEVQFFSPYMDEAGRITYEVSEEYARRVLAAQPDRFFLLTPQELIIRVRREDGLGAKIVTVKSVLPKVAPPLTPSALEPVADEGEPQPAVETLTSPDTVTGKVEGLAEARTAGHKRPKV